MSANHSHADSIIMFRLHNDLTHVVVVAGVYTVHCLVRAAPPRDCPAVLFIGLWPHSFYKNIMMYMYTSTASAL